MEVANKKCSFRMDAFHTPSDTARRIYFYVQWVGHFTCEKEFHLRRKDLKSILILYTMNGGGFLKYRGKEYELRRNQLMIINCVDYQEYYTYKHDFWDFKWIHFYGNMSCEYFNHIFENFGPVINMPEDSSIGEYIDKIILQIKNGDPELEIKASSTIYQILTAILLAASADRNSQKNLEYRNCIKKVREFIENNYEKHICVDDMAAAVNLSRCHFSVVFKGIMGFSPHEYLVNYRINKAKTLLNNTDLSVEDIAITTGFLDASSFIRAFKKHEELTPQKYRSNFSTSENNK